MKIIANMFVLLLSMVSLKAQTTPEGVWNIGKDNSQVEIVEVDGSYMGSLVSSDNENANIGTQLLKDFQPDGKEWTGKFYAPKKGEWFDATLKAEDNLLEITIGSGFRSKTLEWTRE